MRAVATGSAKRLPQLADVPTLAEVGVTADNLDMRWRLGAHGHAA
ncbi:MAG TPA: hypothetical protein PLK50_11190 [Ottowia sp.]|nr:hypothetical protein [Ottowia sp.]HQD46496.1 hypothetical protein [Ottowia sp.]